MISTLSNGKPDFDAMIPSHGSAGYSDRSGSRAGAFRINVTLSSRC
ncbi:MAG: hypothetical protein ACLSFT_06000 [Ruminococcus callidus]